MSLLPSVYSNDSMFDSIYYPTTQAGINTGSTFGNFGKELLGLFDNGVSIWNNLIGRTSAQNAINNDSINPPTIAASNGFWDNYKMPILIVGGIAALFVAYKAVSK